MLLGVIVGLLFAGRWTSGLLADRWWAEEVAPAAAGFITNWHLLRGALKLAGVVVAAAWFIGHLLAVYRAVGSVQVRRNVANLEFREALTPGALVAAVVGAGALIGIMAGRGLAAHAAEVAIGWQGVSYGLIEPLLQRDVGLYVAQLPLWRVLHDFCFLLVMLALALVFGMYLLVGAIRWLDGRPAINSHARIHLGWLLVTLACTLMWGYLLEPFELVAGFHGTPDRALWRATTFVAPVLVGVALATALLSAVWAVRGRHSLAAAGWLVLPLASLAGHWMVPPALGGEGEPLTDRRTMEQFERLAFGLEALAGEPAAGSPQVTAPVVPSLWSRPIAAKLLTADSTELVSLDPALLTVAGRRRPVWLGTRLLPGGRLVMTAQADDRTGPAGEALFYRQQDSVPSPSVQPLRDLGVRAFHARSPRYRIGTNEDAGVCARLLVQAGDARMGAAGAGPVRAARSRCPCRLASVAHRAAGPARAVRPVGRAHGAGRGWRADLDRRRLPAGPGLPALPIDRLARTPSGRVPRGAARHRFGADRRDQDLSAARRGRARVGLGRHRRRRRGAERRDSRGRVAGGAVPGGSLSSAGASARALEPQARVARYPHGLRRGRAPAPRGRLVRRHDGAGARDRIRAPRESVG